MTAICPIKHKTDAARAKCKNWHEGYDSAATPVPTAAPPPSNLLTRVAALGFEKERGKDRTKAHTPKHGARDHRKLQRAQTSRTKKASRPKGKKKGKSWSK